MNAFGVYVHWPFCTAKCPYCDFNSHVRASFDENRWAASVIRELEWVRSAQGPQAPTVESVFFGGGTPSLMSGKSATEIIDAIARLWLTAGDLEVTLEANPASADATRFKDYRAAGVNRISLGVQALNDADLKFLGRLHGVAEAKSALRIAMGAFPRVSLDLIYAREGQTAESWRRELAEALQFGTEHLSLYQLTIEPGTPFALRAREGTIRIPDEDRAAALFELTDEMTSEAGRPAYEVSNHARPGAECRHNLIYWRYGDYAGVGPGAHGRLTLDERRFATVGEKLPERWQEKVSRDGNGYSEINPIDERDGAHENLLMSMRLGEGIDLGDYETRWGVSLDRAKIAALADEKLVRLDGRLLVATPRGRLVLNSVIAELAA